MGNTVNISFKWLPDVSNSLCLLFGFLLGTLMYIHEILITIQEKKKRIRKNRDSAFCRCICRCISENEALLPHGCSMRFTHYLYLLFTDIVFSSK